MPGVMNGPGEVSQPTLVRGLGTWDVGLITIGTILGSAIFVAASIVPRAVPQPSVILLLWVVGGALSMAGVATYSELATMFPEAGGAYHFLKEAYGRLWGFLFGWTSFLVIQCGAIAYLAVASADRTSELWPALGLKRDVLVVPLGAGTWHVQGSQLGAALLIAGLSAVNYVGLREGAGVQ